MTLESRNDGQPHWKRCGRLVWYVIATRQKWAWHWHEKKTPTSGDVRAAVSGNSGHSKTSRVIAPAVAVMDTYLGRAADVSLKSHTDVSSKDAADLSVSVPGARRAGSAVRMSRPRTAYLPMSKEKKMSTIQHVITNTLHWQESQETTTVLAPLSRRTLSYVKITNLGLKTIILTRIYQFSQTHSILFTSTHFLEHSHRIPCI